MTASLLSILLGLTSGVLLFCGLRVLLRARQPEPEPLTQDDFTPAMRRWEAMLNRWGVWQ